MPTVKPARLPAPDLREASAAREGARSGLERWIAQQLLRSLGEPRLRLVLWNGAYVGSEEGELEAELKIADRSTFWRLILNPELEFGEAYSDGRLQVEGDLVAALRSVFEAPPLGGVWRWLSLLINRHARRNTLARSRHNVHHHYDLGNDFYRLWLDREMLYTCAYYPTEGVTLERAQQAKMDHVCRKLRLEPGQRVVEAGSGWGALALHMARHYGVTVKSFNVSQEQTAYAQERARREGLDDRVEFVLDDYRSIRGRFDVFVSVGMLEHVGVKDYRALGALIRQCLEPQGIGLIHTIGRNRPRRLNAWIQSRIFPGAQPPTLREMSEIFEENDLSVLDVENLRLHYALTLRDWLRRYDQHSEEVRRRFDERFTRAWRLYLCGSIAAFEAGSLQLFQVVFNPARSNTVAMTRSELYRSNDREASTDSPAGAGS